MTVNVRKAHKRDSSIVADMVSKLLSELDGKPIGLNNSMLNLAHKLLKQQKYEAFLAFTDSEQCIGVITTCESFSLYASGIFGIIQEFYVAPSHRSEGVGHQLLKAVYDYGNMRGWSRIEVGAPDEHRWERTIAFYQREGFREIGPRLKFPLS